MPRQRVIQSNVESASEAAGVKTEGTTRSSNEEESSAGDKDEPQGAGVLNGNQPEGRSNEAVNEKERGKEKEISKYSEKVLDMSIKLKVRRVTFVCVRSRV